MREVLVVVFWLWLFTSLTVYAYRIFRRLTRGKPATGRCATPIATPVPGAPLKPGSTLPPLISSPPVTADPAAGPEPSDGAPITVAEAVQGIRMPCDLAPLVGSSTAALDPHRVVFSTTTATAPQVGGALADELERLGFSVRSVADNQAVATKPGATVTVTIHTDLSAFPTAPAGSVVVTLAT